MDILAEKLDKKLNEWKPNIRFYKKEGDDLITKDLLKEEIDKVQDNYLNILYRIIKALEKPFDSEDILPLDTLKISNWENFIKATYGCMADDQIDRGE